MSRPETLSGWLAFIERQHPSAIALGLDRVREVLARLEAPIACPVITVGGTNGKGSTCALLEAVLNAGGYRAGRYSSPHLLRYNERVRVAGAEATDDALCEAFAAVEAVRRGVALTYFEYGTLAALWLFARACLDALVLEVGLGGRLDAVNAIDADCAVITSIDLDHTEYLGATRESIGREKAGIFRKDAPAVLGLPDVPQAVCEAVRACGAVAYRLGRDFGYSSEPRQWSYWGPAGKRHGLAYPALRGTVQLRNAAAALCALDCLRERLPLGMQEIREGLARVSLPGRFQVLPGRPQIILDVAHNPEAARVLAANLRSCGYAASTIAVAGMLRDKDIAAVTRTLAPLVDVWHLASLGGPRGASAAELQTILLEQGIGKPAALHADPAAAFAAAKAAATPDDKIIVFGSFLTVSAILALLDADKAAFYG